MKEYIEKDAVLKLMNDLRNYKSLDFVDAIEVVEKQPAADVVEVRHGRWIKVHDEVCYWLACSVCGEEIPQRFGTDYYTNYCPNCGAKMDGGADDDDN